jgi:hypothetical protein
LFRIKLETLFYVAHSLSFAVLQSVHTNFLLCIALAVP